MEWISVEERLPANHDIVIVTDGKTTTISAYDHGFMFTMLPYIEIVTHWMPLPKPPKE